MTQEERDKIIEIKKSCIKWLQNYDILPLDLPSIDERVYIYVDGCISHPEKHNVYELLSVKRFIEFFDKYQFRADLVRRFYAMYEALPFIGLHGRTQFKLTPVQAFQFANIYGWYDDIKIEHKDENDEVTYTIEPRRVIREALLFVPRKFSKTTSVASIAIEDFLFGDATAESYVAANSFKQAQICFKIIKNTLKGIDPNNEYFKTNKEVILSLDQERPAKIECLASAADKLDGLNASTVILDEYAAAKSADLYNVLTSSMGARANPLTCIITTASNNPDGPFKKKLDHFKKVLIGELDNDSIFAHIFEPDAGDEPGDESTWRKVQPHLGVTVSIDFYRDKWMNAQQDIEQMTEFRNKLLNVFTSGTSDVWIEREKINNLMMHEDIMNGTPALCAIDLSIRDDLSATTFLFRDDRRTFNGKPCPLHSITKFYLPEETLATHTNRDLYAKWADEGYITITKGNVIDYSTIALDILNSPYTILAVGYDKYKAKDLVNILNSSNPNGMIIPISQTYGAFNPYVQVIEYSVETKAITFEPSPVVSWCFGNCVLDEDTYGNQKPIKIAKDKKIDGAVTNIMALALIDKVNEAYQKGR